MNRDQHFYTNDITLMPLSFIWRTIRRSSKLGAPFLFLKLATRKMARRRYPAYYGSQRPEKSWIVDAEDLPEDGRVAISGMMPDCLNAGFELAFYTKGAHIGGKSTSTAILVDTSSNSCAIIHWLRMAPSNRLISRLLFSCVSFRINGEIVTTAALSEADWIPEVVPPNHCVNRVTVGMSPIHIITAHREQIGRHSSEFHSITSENAVDFTLSCDQGIFDHMVSHRYYDPLTEFERRKLSE